MSTYYNNVFVFCYDSLRVKNMAKKYFGTDGIRGKVNLGAMTPEMAMKIGMAW